MTSPDDACVPFEHGGTRWSVPVRLIRLQQEWDEADALCREAALDDARYDEAWSRRLDASLDLQRDPWRVGHGADRAGAEAALRACAGAARIEVVR
jgi:hypothetical protein